MDDNNNEEEIPEPLRIVVKRSGDTIIVKAPRGVRFKKLNSDPHNPRVQRYFTRGREYYRCKLSSSGLARQVHALLISGEVPIDEDNDMADTWVRRATLLAVERKLFKDSLQILDSLANYWSSIAPDLRQLADSYRRNGTVPESHRNGMVELIESEKIRQRGYKAA